MATAEHHPELDTLCRGFDVLALAATFFAAIQAQVMSAMVAPPDKDSTTIRATNAFFFGGLILDIMSASLAFLTSRWFQRLSNSEKKILQDVFSDKKNSRYSTTKAAPQSILGRIFIAWLSLSLFAPMPLLVFGVICMVSGIYTHLWSQHPTVVAAIATGTGVVTLPFLLGDFLIGREEGRRIVIIHRLGRIQGDW